MHSNQTVEADVYLTQLDNISRRILTYACLFYVVFGNVGNIFKTLFFMQKPLKACPCTVYIRLATIGHFFTLNNIPALSLLLDHWNIREFERSSSGTNKTLVRNVFLSAGYSTMTCKIQIYLHTWSSNLSLQILVFASLNRFFMTLKKTHRWPQRHFSDFFCSLSSAYALCFVACIVWAVMSLPCLFAVTLTNHQCDAHNIFTWGTRLCVIYFAQMILMICFGTLTIRYRQTRALILRRRCRNHHEMTPMFNQLCQHCRCERSELHHVETQLTSMIVTEIVLVILSSLPYAIYIVYRLATARHVRSSTGVIYEHIAERLVQLTIFFEPSCGFYIYLFTLTSLKRRFFNIARRKLGITP